ncbi:hypothetical protein [Klebsiella quasipneumoniae]|uniref:hypothetical protein n=1 Tax=Klebsiella quasipneumoniae TaxID=1463165 RepID=UPI002B055F8A|nr:hypothetical protein [Klebsiella quasipneumoniae]
MSEKIVTYTDQVSCFGKNISHRFSSSTSTTCNQQYKKNTPCPHKIRQEWLTLDEAAEVIRQHSTRCYPPTLSAILLVGATAVFVCDAAVTANCFMVRDNGIDGRKWL